ncbi:Caffeoyl-CoA O-methyltransferase 1 [Glycine soja]
MKTMQTFYDVAYDDEVIVGSNERDHVTKLFAIFITGQDKGAGMTCTGLMKQEEEKLREKKIGVDGMHKSGNLMATPLDEGQLFSMLLKLMNANNTMEIGVYTGYSLRSTALALPPDGKEDNKGAFNFIFVDADKDNYLNYHKRVIDLVKIRGLIGYDKTLWNGSVVASADAPMKDYIKNYRGHVIELNKYPAQDSRIDICQLPVGDGITLCRRII